MSLNLLRIIFATLGFVMFSSCQLTPQGRYISELEVSLNRNPFSEEQDVYKLIFQSAMGSAHEAEYQSTRKHLHSEVLQLRGSGPPFLCEPIPPGGKLVRVHIRPYLRTAASIDDLAAAFVQTAETFKPSKERLERYLGYAERAAELERIPFDPDDLKSYFAAKAEEGYPAVHHSTAFSTAYLPAYRVVAVDLVPVDCRLYVRPTGSRKW